MFPVVPFSVLAGGYESDETDDNEPSVLDGCFLSFAQCIGNSYFVDGLDGIHCG